MSSALLFPCLAYPPRPLFPQNKDYRAPPGTRPPLLVKAHGGPTSAATKTYSPAVQFFTSRGFAILDVDYRGSTGYGTLYRTKLHEMYVRGQGEGGGEAVKVARRRRSRRAVVGGGREVCEGKEQEGRGGTEKEGDERREACEGLEAEGKRQEGGEGRKGERGKEGGSEKDEFRERGKEAKGRE